MKLRICSDLHLEFSDIIFPPTNDDKNTVLVLAGDTCTIHGSMAEKRLRPFIKRVSGQFAAVVAIMGNHEHYGGNFRDTKQKYDDFIKAEGVDNYFLLEKSHVQIEDVVFVGATLWTDCDAGKNPYANVMFGTYMNDGRVIRNGAMSERPLTAQDTIGDHKTAVFEIERLVTTYKEQGLKPIVVVHHGVTEKSIHRDYNGSAINMFFSSEMTQLWQKIQPSLIIHGHTHKCLDYVVDGTDIRVVVNPRGYVTYQGQENPYFDSALVLNTDTL